MSAISISHLNKSFSVHKKNPGLRGSIEALFSRKYSFVHAVRDVNFSIEEGELVGFIGPNGAGKTTTLKCLSGLLYPTSGTISVLGHTPVKREKNFLTQIALVMGQKSMLWWDLPAYETFLLNKEIYGISQKQFTETIEELATLLDVEDQMHIQVRKLSLGQRMKCELIAGLIHRPKILFLDEPTIGLDVVMQKKLRDFIREYNQRTKATVILTSHYMTDVQELCKRVIVIDHGSVLFDGELDSIVKKYAPDKILNLIFHKEVRKEDLAQFGTISQYSPLEATLSIPQENLQQNAAQILQKFPVADITITEMNIEDIIRDIFSQKHL